MTTAMVEQPFYRTIRVLVFDDQALVREGTAKLLGMDGDIEVVGQAGGAREAMDMVAETRPDVAVVDINVPGRGGLAFARRALAHHPDLRVLVLSAYDQPEMVDEAIEAGVSGYLLTTASTGELLRAVRAVAAGIFVLDGALSRRMAHRGGGPPPVGLTAALTQRESDVLALLVEGLSNKRIAAELGLGVRTVEGYVSSVLGKLGAASRTEAVLLSLRHRLLPGTDGRSRPTGASITQL